MLVKKLFAVLGMSFLVAATAGNIANAQNNISTTFNREALTALYATQCDARVAMRRENVVPPFDAETPDYLRVKDSEFVLSSTQMSRMQNRRIKAMYNGLSDHIKDIAYMRGVAYVFPRRTMIEALPSLRDEPGYNNDHGLYFQRRIYLPFDTAQTRTDKNGKIHVVKYIPSVRNQPHVLNHESGHMADDILGFYSLDQGGPDGEARLTNRSDYVDAYTRDLTRLVNNRSAYAGDIARLAYFLPREFEGKHLGGARHPSTDKDENLRRSRREVFAELWAHANGYTDKGIASVMTESYAVVKKYNDFLKDLHKTAPVKCNYTMDGRATPK